MTRPPFLNHSSEQMESVTVEASYGVRVDLRDSLKALFSDGSALIVSTLLGEGQYDKAIIFEGKRNDICLVAEFYKTSIPKLVGWSNKELEERTNHNEKRNMKVYSIKDIYESFQNALMKFKKDNPGKLLDSSVGELIENFLEGKETDSDTD